MCVCLLVLKLLLGKLMDRCIIHHWKQNFPGTKVIYISNPNFNLRMRSRILQFSRKIFKIFWRSHWIWKKVGHCLSDDVIYFHTIVPAEPNSRMRILHVFKNSEYIVLDNPLTHGKRCNNCLSAVTIEGPSGPSLYILIK